MAVFSYVAMDNNSKKIKGQIQADSISNAATDLRSKNYIIISLDEAVEAQVKNKAFNPLDYFGVVTSNDIAFFFRQLAILIRSGITISDSLYILERQIKKRKLKKILRSIIDDIEEGTSFSSSLKKHKNVFNHFINNMIVCGEEGGILEIVLERIADQLEESVNFRTQLITGLIYPSIVIIFGVVVVIFLTGFVLPRFIPFLSARGETLPPVTQLLIDITNFANEIWKKVVLVLMAIGTGVICMARIKQTKYYVDAVKIRIPVFGMIIRTGIIVQFADNLSSLIDSGVSIQDSLNAVKNTINNEVAINVIDKIEDRISNGEDFSTPVRESSVIFPEMVAEMISVGEQTGGLEHMLSLVATNYKRLLEKNIKRMTALIEPAIIIFLGATVGFVVWALLAGVLSMYGAYNR